LISDSCIKVLNIQDTEWQKDGKVLFEISKGILKKLESYRIYLQDRLFDYLDTAGFHQVPHHNGLLQYESRSIIFSLVVHDFGIKYVSHDDVNYLAEKLRKIYEITMDWTSSKYLGINVDHDYHANEIAINIPHLIAILLNKNHKNGRCVYSPAPYLFVPNGQKSILPIRINESVITENNHALIRTIAGSTLYYSRVIDHTMFCDVNNTIQYAV
jgi:hypothetical protein